MQHKKGIKNHRSSPRRLVLVVPYWRVAKRWKNPKLDSSYYNRERWRHREGHRVGDAYGEAWTKNEIGLGRFKFTRTTKKHPFKSLTVGRDSLSLTSNLFRIGFSDCFRELSRERTPVEFSYCSVGIECHEKLLDVVCSQFISSNLKNLVSSISSLSS